MRILIHDFGGYSFCLELSREIARRGHDVQHAFFPAFSAGMTNVERRSDDPESLVIVPIGADLPYTRYVSLLRRGAQEVAYGRRLAAHIRIWRPDVVISGNASLDIQKAALSASRAVKARFIFWQQDVVSAAMSVLLPERLGVFGTLIASHYRRIERRIATQSDAVICISDDFLPNLQDWGIPAARCHVIENWAPKDDIHPLPKDNPWSCRHGFADKKVFLYSGRLGLKHDPEFLLQLARSYRDDSKTVVLVVSEGPGADWLAARKVAENLDGLRLMPFQAYAELPHILATGDVLIAIIANDAHRYSVPSKVLSYLAAGRAILAAMPEANTNARHIQRIGAGIVIPLDDSERLLAAARALMGDEVLRMRAARAARYYAEEHFNIRRISDRFLCILTGAAD